MTFQYYRYTIDINSRLSKQPVENKRHKVEVLQSVIMFLWIPVRLLSCSLSLVPVQPAFSNMADEQIAPSVGEHELVNEQPTSMLTDEENVTNGAAVRTARDAQPSYVTAVVAQNKEHFFGDCLVEPRLRS